MDAEKLKDLRIDLGGELWMRPVRDGDVDQVLEAVTRNYEHLRTYMEWAKPDYSRIDAETWLNTAVNRTSDDQPFNFGIFRGERMIGTIGFVNFDHAARVTEIGYWIDSAEEGKGIITRATEKMLDLAFGQLEMNRVQIRCADANKRSGAIPRRLGFTHEGTQRQHIARAGVVYDFLTFGLLSHEWEKRKEAVATSRHD